MRQGPLLAGIVLALAGALASARDDHEPNDTPDRATPIQSGVAVRTSIHPVKDVDCFVLTVPEPGVGYLDVLLRDVPDVIAPAMHVLGPDGKKLAETGRTFATPLFHRLLLQAPGKHTVVLSDGRGDWQDGLNDKASEDLMSLEVRFTPVDQAFEPNDKPEEAKASRPARPCRPPSSRGTTWTTTPSPCPSRGTGSSRSA